MKEFFLSKTFGDDEDQKSNESIFPSLTLKQRLIGFGICFGLGFLFQFMSMGSMIGVLVGRPNKFAFLYTCGSVISIFGTFFLIGPVKQFHNMIEPQRRNATLIFVGSIIMTFFSLYCLKTKILTILFVIIQSIAYIWYILSYIPFGQKILAYITSKLTGLF